MKTFGEIFIKAFFIVLGASVIGVCANAVSPNGVPWIHAKKTSIVSDGVEIPIITETQAREYLDDGETIFLDAREEEDYADNHIRGALSMPDPHKEELFPRLEMRLKPTARIIVYCSGLECDMAEKTAIFLAKLDYAHVMVLAVGMEGWEKAGYPVESAR